MQREGALVTGDGLLTGMSRVPQAHPRFARDAFEAHVEIPLTPDQAALAHLLEEARGELGGIRMALRSTLGQLRTEAFGDKETQVQVRERPADFEGEREYLDVLTLFTSFDEEGAKILSILQDQAALRQLYVGWAGLLPNAAKIGQVAFPLHAKEYGIDMDLLGYDRVAALLQNEPSARAGLQAARFPIRERLRDLQLGEFFLGDFNVCHELEEIVLLEPETRRDGAVTGTIHGSARLFHHKRKEHASRQAELYNPNGHPQPLEGLECTGIAYRPCASA